jgi:hypothetical protein
LWRWLREGDRSRDNNRSGRDVGGKGAWDLRRRPGLGSSAAGLTLGRQTNEDRFGNKRWPRLRVRVGGCQRNKRRLKWCKDVAKFMKPLDLSIQGLKNGDKKHGTRSEPMIRRRALKRLRGFGTLFPALIATGSRKRPFRVNEGTLAGLADRRKARSKHPEVPQATYF